MLRDRARTQYGYADNSNDLKLLMLSDAPSSSPMAGAAARVPLRLKHTQLAAILTFAAEIKATSGKTKLLRQLISCSSYPDIEFGIKLAGTNLGRSDAIYAFPRFCAFLLRRYLKEMGPQLEERWLGRH